MDAAAWPLVAMLVAVLVSLVLLAVTCLHCRDRGPMRSIAQANIADESSDFRVMAHSEHTFHRGSAHQTSNHLPPSFSPAVEPGIQLRSRPLTLDTDSNATYENPGDGSGYVNDESDRESDGYIIVVPGEEPNQSGQSTPSLHSYENVPEKKDREYQNVDPQDGSESASDQSAQSDSDSDSDDDDLGNYVNVPESMNG